MPVDTPLDGLSLGSGNVQRALAYLFTLDGTPFHVQEMSANRVKTEIRRGPVGPWP